MAGSLRVFLGMSAGVGKTYAMLKAARARQSEGVDVVIGVVETHGRQETAALVKDLPLIARRKSEYKGVSLEEMDLDAILGRKPALVLVDELAHTNIPGSRHSKRYQDVIELLNAGIDVYTTINVQHLESRKDLVEKITGVPIRETVPDSLLEMAKQIELIDIAPAELLRRLREGKVYLGERAERAAQNFFKSEALTALREIALRFTAEKVDNELQKLHDARPHATPWQSSERLMVAISHSPFSEKLIRTTRRVAFNLEAPWIAVHIDTGRKLSDADQAQLAKNIALARELGAEVIATTDTNLADAIRRIARQKNVSQLMVGRPGKRFWRDSWEGSLLDRLVRDSWDVDVHVIRQDTPPVAQSLPRLWDFETGFLPYWNTLCLFFGVSFLSGFMEEHIGYRAVGFLFLLAVLLVGRVSSLGPVIFAATMSAIVWNYFFIPPRMTFAISQPEDVIMCVSYFLVAMITGTLTANLRRHERLIREREERTNVLYEVLREISASRQKAEFLPKVLSRVGQVLNGDCGVILKDQDGQLKKTNYAVYIDEKEMAVAEWSFTHRKIAGWSTATLSQSKALHVPLEGDRECVGVFVYQPRDARKLSLEQETLLYSVCRQLSVALERHFDEKRLRATERLQESEKLHQTLLNSISHEMRTPLTAILGSASVLEDDRSPDTREFRKKVAFELNAAGDRLNRVIENLLDMSRLNSGVLAIKKEWHDINDLVGVTLQRLGRNLLRHDVRVDLPQDLPLVEMDFRLVEHALANLLMNAVIYTPPGTPIMVRAQLRPPFLDLRIEDSGPGIPTDSLSALFDKFYRVPGSPAGGTGLGLSIVKAIAEFHRGEVRVESEMGKGSRFILSLPLGEPPEGPHES